jgi:hypothetical protein
MLRKYTKEQFIDAVSTSRSIAQALIKLGLIPHGGNYHCFKNLAKKLNIDTSHFVGQGWSKNSKIGTKRPITDYLSNKCSIQSHKLRLRLIKENILPPYCNSCKLTEWLGKPIPLELEHKDGNHDNNSLNNLELLCPNCHAFTPTYRGKNKKTLRI